jgi:ATP-dependent Clp protease ATP-binding subunit ClpX
MGKADRNRNAYCSFCRKSYREVGPLVEGPGGVYICAECVELCASIIDQEKRRRGRAEGTTPVKPTRELVLASLDRLFRSHDEFKEGLALAATDAAEASARRLHRPVLLIGPSRSAKVFGARALAHALEVPFARVDAETLVSSERPPDGSLLQRIFKAADFDAEAARRSVVYVDGIERPEIQEGLMQLWDGLANDPLSKRMNLDFARLVFVCGGGFPGLCDFISRMKPDPDQVVTGEVMEAAGIAPALIVRILAVVSVEPLDEESLERIISQVDLGRLAATMAD